jgi:hypothetical protein
MKLPQLQRTLSQDNGKLERAEDLPAVDAMESNGGGRLSYYNFRKSDRFKVAESVMHARNRLLVVFWTFGPAAPLESRRPWWQVSDDYISELLSVEPESEGARMPSNASSPWRSAV